MVHWRTAVVAFRTSQFQRRHLGEVVSSPDVRWVQEPLVQLDCKPWERVEQAVARWLCPPKSLVLVDQVVIVLNVCSPHELGIERQWQSSPAAGRPGSLNRGVQLASVHSLAHP